MVKCHSFCVWWVVLILCSYPDLYLYLRMFSVTNKVNLCPSANLCLAWGFSVLYVTQCKVSPEYFYSQSVDRTGSGKQPPTTSRLHHEARLPVRFKVIWAEHKQTKIVHLNCGTLHPTNLPHKEGIRLCDAGPRCAYSVQIVSLGCPA